LKILVIDNYDSFVYNLVHYLEEFGCQVTVIRNDELNIDMVSIFDKILISPGPGLPNEAGIIKQLIKEFGPTKSILGVCLGHQAICEVYGGFLVQLDEVKHGVMSKISTLVNDESLFDGLGNQFEVGRYHSWVVDKDSISEVLEVTATDQEGQVMSIRHRDFDVKGVQFHPESILTPLGKKIISNWISGW
jgi:anthranilate synthase component 2